MYISALTVSPRKGEILPLRIWTIKSGRFVVWIYTTRVVNIAPKWLREIKSFPEEINLILGGILLDVAQIQRCLNVKKKNVYLKSDKRLRVVIDQWNQYTCFPEFPVNRKTCFFSNTQTLYRKSILRLVLMPKYCSRLFIFSTLLVAPLGQSWGCSRCFPTRDGAEEYNALRLLGQHEKT